MNRVHKSHKVRMVIEKEIPTDSADRAKRMAESDMKRLGWNVRSVEVIEE